MKTKILLSNLLILLSGTMITTASFAQDRHPSKDSKFWLDAGGYYATEAVVLWVESDILGENLPINLQRDVDFGDPEVLPMIEFGWRFGEKWSVALQYFDTEKSKSFSIAEEIEWEDLVFEIGVDARIGTGASVTRIALDRILHESENHRFNLAFGLHVLTVDAFIEGVARLDDDSTEFRRSKVETGIPLPNIGFSYLYSPSRNWALFANVDWFDASIGEYSGLMVDMSVGANLRLSDHFGIGLEYRALVLDGDIDGNDWKGGFKSDYKGPALTLTGYW